jgi:hypothetical protein
MEILNNEIDKFIYKPIIYKKEDEGHTIYCDNNGMRTNQLIIESKPNPKSNLKIDNEFVKRIRFKTKKRLTCITDFSYKILKDCHQVDYTVSFY